MKIQFYKQYKSKDYWQILEDYYFETQYGVIKVPSSFVTDFGSIPRVFWWISHPLKHPYYYAFLLHDYEYSCKGTLSRLDADDVFYQELKKHSKLKAILFYVAVRMFGWMNYKRPLPFKK